MNKGAIDTPKENEIVILTGYLMQAKKLLSDLGIEDEVTVHSPRVFGMLISFKSPEDADAFLNLFLDD